MLNVQIAGVEKIKQIGESTTRSANRLGELLQQASEEFALRAVSRIKRDYLSGGPGKLNVRTGRLRSSITSSTERRDNEIVTRIGTDVPYARAWEFGRRPGSFPPVAPLALWARRALGVPAKDAQSVGFLIARRIFQRGQKARPFLRPGVEDELPEFRQRIESLLEQVAVAGLNGKQ